MGRKKINLLALVTVGLTLTTGCRPETGRTLSPHQRQAIQARTADFFDLAVLFKPHGGDLNSPPVAQLAPLIIQQVTQTNTASLWRDVPGNSDPLPLVTSEAGTTMLNNRAHQQFTYSWSYPSSDPPQQAIRTAQGLRLTLDSSAAPVIWEVLEDSTKARIIYVAQSLEQSARIEFGPPLPGRKFSIERSLSESPEVVVANVIEDGPVAMGPIVYLQQPSRDITALICRCMPAQVRTIADQKDYELQQITNSWRGNGFPTTSLIHSLRLPSRF